MLVGAGRRPCLRIFHPSVIPIDRRTVDGTKAVEASPRKATASVCSLLPEDAALTTADS